MIYRFVYIRKHESGNHLILVSDGISQWLRENPGMSYRVRGGNTTNDSLVMVDEKLLLFIKLRWPEIT